LLLRRTIALSLLLAALPGVAQARYDSLGPAAPPPPFPVDGPWEWGGPDTAFGDRGGSHDGIDVMSPCGTPVVAPAGGRVVFTENAGAAGNYLVLRVDGSGEHQVFMHLQRPARAGKGEAIAAGERIGAVGRTGNASACHLHFEIWRPPGWQRGRARDPRPDLERWAPS
jgi:murein DD-endopeptidase MepM/ murein hydrolase activator NlpD